MNDDNKTQNVYSEKNVFRTDYLKTIDFKFQIKNF